MSSSEDKPSAIWYLVAILFGLLGGIIAYIATRDRDPDMASNCMIISILVMIAGAVLMLPFLF